MLIAFLFTLRLDESLSLLLASLLLLLPFLNIVKLFLLPTLVLFLFPTFPFFLSLMHLSRCFSYFWYVMIYSVHGHVVWVIGFGVVMCASSGFVLLATPREVLVFGLCCSAMPNRICAEPIHIEV